jgi:hypothetical protein
MHFKPFKVVSTHKFKFDQIRFNTYVSYGRNCFRKIDPSCAEINRVYFDLKLCNGNDYPNYTLVVSPEVKKVSGGKQEVEIMFMDFY